MACLSHLMLDIDIPDMRVEYIRNKHRSDKEIIERLWVI